MGWGLNHKLKYFCSKNVYFRRRAKQIGRTQAYHKQKFVAENSWEIYVIFQQNITIKSNLDHILHDCRAISKKYIAKIGKSFQRID